MMLEGISVSGICEEGMGGQTKIVGSNNNAMLELHSQH